MRPKCAEMRLSVKNPYMKDHLILKKGITGVVCAILLILIDQLTKLAAAKYLKGNAALVLWQGVFELRYLENQGAAFGVLQNRQQFFLIVTLIAVILIGWIYLFRIPAGKRYIPLDIISVMLLSGAIGNFIDRVANHYVIDFFYFVLIDFPIFNVADIYVTVGTALLILLGVFYYKDTDYELIFPSKKERAEE
jgi:signal peptidase II